MAVKLAEGTRAPDFRLMRDGGDTISLKDFSGRKLVLFFYPKADTSGCTLEAKDFSRLKSAFDKAGIAVVGVSADPVRKQDAFKTKHGLTTPLASDETHEMLEAYGVWGEKSMYGRTYMGINRTTVLIGADGRIARIWPKLKIEGHAEDVLAAATSA
jgi:peroxiredoxin Q/BCP